MQLIDLVYEFIYKAFNYRLRLHDKSSVFTLIRLLSHQQLTVLEGTQQQVLSSCLNNQQDKGLLLNCTEGMDMEPIHWVQYFTYWEDTFNARAWKWLHCKFYSDEALQAFLELNCRMIHCSFKLTKRVKSKMRETTLRGGYDSVVNCVYSYSVWSWNRNKSNLLNTIMSNDEALRS